MSQNRMRSPTRPRGRASSQKAALASSRLPRQEKQASVTWEQKACRESMQKVGQRSCGASGKALWTTCFR